MSFTPSGPLQEVSRGLLNRGSGNHQPSMRAGDYVIRSIVAPDGIGLYEMFLKVSLKDDKKKFMALVTLSLSVRPVGEDGREIIVGDRKNELADIFSNIGQFVADHADESADKEMVVRVGAVFGRISESLRENDGKDAIVCIIDSILSSVILTVYEQAGLSIVRKSPTIDNWKSYINNF